MYACMRVACMRASCVCAGARPSEHVYACYYACKGGKERESERQRASMLMHATMHARGAEREEGEGGGGWREGEVGRERERETERERRSCGCVRTPLPAPPPPSPPSFPISFFSSRSTHQFAAPKVLVRGKKTKNHKKKSNCNYYSSPEKQLKTTHRAAKHSSLARARLFRIVAIFFFFLFFFLAARASISCTIPTASAGSI
jgi:hypothetical protein